MAKRRANHEGTIRQRKNGLWEAIVTIGRDPRTGKLKRVSFYAPTQKEAVQKAAKARHDLARGTFVTPERMTLGQWLDVWLTTYKRGRVRQLTQDNYARVIRNHLQPVLGHIVLQALRPEQVQHYCQTKAAQGLDASTITTHLRVLSNALRQAEKLGRVSRNVVALVDTPRAIRKERQTLSMAQVRDALVPAIKGHRLSAAFLVLFLTGVRRGELLGLRWQDVDLDTGVLHVRQILERVTAPQGTGRKTMLAFLEPKTDSSRRTIALPGECVTALRQHRVRQAEERLRLGAAYQSLDLVFATEEGKPIDPRTMNDRFAQALAHASVPHIRLHDARHTFATWMLQAGVPLKTVSDQLGHSSIAITGNVYSHVTREIARAAADTLNQAFTTGS
jgi:integrase